MKDRRERVAVQVGLTAEGEVQVPIPKHRMRAPKTAPVPWKRTLSQPVQQLAVLGDFFSAASIISIHCLATIRYLAARSQIIRNSRDASGDKNIRDHMVQSLVQQVTWTTQGPSCGERLVAYHRRSKPSLTATRAHRALFYPVWPLHKISNTLKCPRIRA